MAKFAIDLLTGNGYLFGGDLTTSGETPTSGTTYPEVDLYSNLPTPASAHLGEKYLVRNGEGNYIANRKDSGIYFSDGLTWRALPTISPYFNSNNFQIYDDNDNTKGVSIVTSGISANNFRKVQIQNVDGTIAYTKDVDLKVDSQIFNIYTGDTKHAIKRIRNFLGNGIISGFTISINSNNTKIDISKGIGYFYDNYDVPDIPTEFTLDFSGKTGITLQFLSTNNATYLAIDVNGNIIQQTTQFTESQRRFYIIIGAAIHSNMINVNVVNNLPDVVLDGHSQFNDLLDALKNFNKEGNVFSSYSNNLTIKKSAGKLFKRGVNFNIDNKNPHVISLVALNAPTNIRYRLSDGTEYGDTSQISLYYESTPGVRTALPNSDYTIQRIILFPSNLIRIQYGQSKYNTMQMAKQSILTDPFIFENNIAENGLLRAYLIVAGKTTNLSDTNNAIFIEADKFGIMPLGSAGGLSSLQQSYDSSLIPQIITSNVQGTFTLKNGMSSDTQNIIGIQNINGNTTVNITGDGNLILPKTSGIGVKIDTTLPTFGWMDLIGNIHTRAGGSRVIPKLVAYQGEIYQYSFGTTSGVVEIINEFHIVHDYVPNTNIYIHTHWSTNAAPTGNVNWMFEATYSQGYGRDVFPTTVMISAVQTATTAYSHMISEVQLSAPNGLIASAVNVSIISGGNTLTASSSLFTSADIGRTISIVGAGVGGTNLDTTIIAFASTTSVTVNANAITTVTAQPNLRYRVLDTSKLEIDGIILVRTWRDSSRTADTLNVAPFIHFVDIHYQSTRIGTKNKNYPFYT